MRILLAIAFTFVTLSSFLSPAQAQLGGLTSGLEQKAEQTIIDQITKQIGEALGQGSPLLLDQHTALEAAPDITNFHPKFFQPTAQDLGRRLPPGDYAVPVTGFCTQYSIHAPGRGLGYKLARVQGKQAGAISALLVQGSLHGVSPYTLNADAWRIQAGVPLSQWSPEDQAMIHALIPKHEKELQGDFLQQLHSTYDSKCTIKFLGMKKRIPGLPSFEAVIAMMGNTGKTIMKLEASRQILTDRTISAERLPDALFEPQGDGLPRVLPPSTDPSPSPWAQVQPGVFARYTIIDGNMGRNLYEFRVTPAASQQNNVTSNPTHSLMLVGFTPSDGGPTLGAITGMGDPSGNGAALNIGYSIGQGAQALIAVPILAPPSPTTPRPQDPTATDPPDQVVSNPFPPAANPAGPNPLTITGIKLGLPRLIHSSSGDVFDEKLYMKGSGQGTFSGHWAQSGLNDYPADGETIPVSVDLSSGSWVQAGEKQIPWADIHDKSLTLAYSLASPTSLQTDRLKATVTGFRPEQNGWSYENPTLEYYVRRKHNTVGYELINYSDGICMGMVATAQYHYNSKQSLPPDTISERRNVKEAQFQGQGDEGYWARVDVPRVKKEIDHADLFAASQAEAHAIQVHLLDSPTGMNILGFETVEKEKKSEWSGHAVLAIAGFSSSDLIDDSNVAADPMNMQEVNQINVFSFYDPNYPGEFRGLFLGMNSYGSHIQPFPSSSYNSFYRRLRLVGYSGYRYIPVELK